MLERFGLRVEDKVRGYEFLYGQDMVFRMRCCMYVHQVKIRPASYNY